MAIHYSRSVHLKLNTTENSRPTPSNTPRIKSPETLTGQQLFKSHKIYPLAMWKEFHRKGVRSRRSATPKILSSKKFWSTCGLSHLIRPVTSIAGSVWAILISICRPYSTTDRECEKSPRCFISDTSTAIFGTPEIRTVL
jgi:hypothetical protein